MEIDLTKPSEDNFFNGVNTFLMSDDTRVFNKLIQRAFLAEKVKDIPGDIVECGVFKGSGFYTFLKLKNIFNPNSAKKVIGFDFFDTTNLLESIKNNENQRKMMEELFKGRDFEHLNSYKDYLEAKILKDGFKPHEFKLIKGDICKTSKEFSEQNLGFKISLLYMDLDLDEPTYETLVNLWDNMTIGGIIVFDEYGYHSWSESRGVDRFCQEKRLEIKSLNSMCPTAYLVKGF